MKKYQILVKQGYTGTVDAEDEVSLKKKLATGHYGVLPPTGKTVIPFTPENVKEIVEITSEDLTQ